MEEEEEEEGEDGAGRWSLKKIAIILIGVERSVRVPIVVQVNVGVVAKSGMYSNSLVVFNVISWIKPYQIEIWKICCSYSKTHKAMSIPAAKKAP